MKILGIAYGAHSSGICLIEDGKILCCLEEERHNRIKQYVHYHNNWFRFPVDCLSELFNRQNYKFSDIDFISSHNSFEEICHVLSCVGINFNNKSKFIYVDHHDCHAFGAYFTSGFKEKCLNISMDGMGFGYSAKYYLGENNNLELISGLTSEMSSLGLYYSTLTDFLEFKRNKDEGKVVGMSSHGNFDKAYYDMFYDLISGEKYFTKHLSYKQMITDLYNSFFNIVGDNYWKNKKQDLAYNGQLAFENRIIEIINALHLEYPEFKKIVLSGGVFANIKLNKRLNDIDWVDEIFVMPPMGDEGIALGSCMFAYKKMNESFEPFKLSNVFFGSSYTTEECLQDWNDEELKVSKYKPENVALKLLKGEIIGFFQDGYEHGPRALGNRSILAHPGLETTYKKVNDRLERNDFMPFAPSVLFEKSNEVFLCEKSTYTGEFMTMLYDTNQEWINKIPAVVHPIDKTARAQIVRKENNPKFYEIINEFYKLSNIPLLLNTSFNIHEEPIVCKPSEAMKHLSNNIVDGLVINDLFFERK